MSAIFAANSNGLIVHVTEVERGLACECRCLSCSEPLISRQGPIRGHHFAHLSGRDPCESNHESILHLYAKRVIAQAAVITVPVNKEIDAATQSGKGAAARNHSRLEIGQVWIEKNADALRPDLTVSTSDGVIVAIEVAYTSFCSDDKIATYAAMKMPALEIDLRRYTPMNFDPVAVRMSLVESIEDKKWLWPSNEPVSLPDTSPHAGSAGSFDQVVSQIDPSVRSPQMRPRLKEEIISFSGRWVSIKEFDSGDISVKSVHYDPDVVSMIKEIANDHRARYNPRYKSWTFSRFRAAAVREALRRYSQENQIASKAINGSCA